MHNLVPKEAPLSKDLKAVTQELAIKQFGNLQRAWHEALAENDLVAVKSRLDVEDAFRKFIQHQDLADEFKDEVTADFLRGERKLGGMLTEKPKNKGGGPQQQRFTGYKNDPVKYPPTYAELGLEKRRALRDQCFFKIEEDFFEGLISKAQANKSLSVTTIWGDVRRELNRRSYRKRVIEAGDQGMAQGPFDVILADPPWDYEFSPTSSRQIGNHYDTRSVEEICEDVPDAADNSACFLWAPPPKLLEAMEVLSVWGFGYRSHFVWDKEIIGMGYWCRVQHESLLVGVRGDFKAPPDIVRVPSIFREKRTQHSVKPEAVFQWIEKAFPGFTKLEMYARKPRPGWAAWGNEISSVGDPA